MEQLELRFMSFDREKGMRYGEQPRIYIIHVCSIPCKSVEPPWMLPTLEAIVSIDPFFQYSPMEQRFDHTTHNHDIPILCEHSNNNLKADIEYSLTRMRSNVVQPFYETP